MPNANDSGWASTVVVGSLTGIALTAEWLPQQVAAHFALDGRADHFLARDQYLALMIGSTVVATALVTGLLSTLVLRFPDLLNLPNRSFWLAPERRASTHALVSSRAVWLGATDYRLEVRRENGTIAVRLESLPLTSRICGASSLPRASSTGSRVCAPAMLWLMTHAKGSICARLRSV